MNIPAKAFAILAIATGALWGCATGRSQPAGAATLTSVQNQRITYTLRSKPDFVAMTAGKGAFALVGAFAAISEGNKLVTTNDISDPAEAISKGLVTVLQDTQGAIPSNPPVFSSTSDVAGIVSAVNGSARFAFDVQTVNWGFNYFPADWTHYRVSYFAKARLIDLESRSVVAEGSCKKQKAETSNPPTYDQLLADGAAMLKKELSDAAQDCLEQLKVQMLSQKQTS